MISFLVVAGRRQLAEELLKDYNAAWTPGARTEFIEVQKVIKLINEAIEDEQKRVPSSSAKASGGKDDRYAPIEPGQDYI